MHHGWTSRVLKPLLQALSFGGPDRVLGMDTRVTRRNPGRARDPRLRKQCVVLPGHLLSKADLIVEDLQLGQKHGRLQRVEAAVHAQPSMVITGVLPVARNASELFGQCGVAGEKRAAVAIAAQWLAGEETGAGHEAQAA